MPASDYEVDGGLRVECARPSDPYELWVYRIIEYGPERRLIWAFSDPIPSITHMPKPVLIQLPRVGNFAATPVTAQEAEIVLGWPVSGWESLDNPVFDALRELVHASS